MRFVLEDFEWKNILGYLTVSDQVFFITNICNYIFFHSQKMSFTEVKISNKKGVTLWPLTKNVLTV